MLPPEMVPLVPCNVAPASTVVTPVQALAVLVRTIVPLPPMVTYWLGPAVGSEVIAPVSVSIEALSASSRVGSPLAGAGTASRMLFE